MITSIPETKDTFSSQRCSMKVEVKQQLAWINSTLETASGSERRALEKAREELLRLLSHIDKHPG